MSASLGFEILQKKRNGNNEVYADSTIAQYFGSIKESIRDVSSRLPVWNDHDKIENPEACWYSTMLSKPRRGFASTRLGNTEIDYEPNKCRSIPMVTRQSLLRPVHRIFAEVKGADMKTIVESIIRAEEEGCYQNWAQLIVGVVAIARYGENKFPAWAKVRLPCCRSYVDETENPYQASDLPSNLPRNIFGLLPLGFL